MSPPSDSNSDPDPDPDSLGHPDAAFVVRESDLDAIAEAVKSRADGAPDEHYSAGLLDAGIMIESRLRERAVRCDEDVVEEILIEARVDSDPEEGGR